MATRIPVVLLLLSIAILTACGGSRPESGLDEGMLRAFAPLPRAFLSDHNPTTPEKVALGRALYHDPRLSMGGDVSCASCHPLDRFGADGEPVSPGHLGQRGTRNSPTVLNAAGQFAQFWDGRAADVEEQVEDPVLNPVEMAMESAEDTEEALRSEPAYREAFSRAFPSEVDPVTFDNAALAIAAFERTLVTPAPWDRFLGGDESALTAEQVAGFRVFASAGCATCHRGALVGGEMFNRLGVVKPWPDTADLGRFEVTGHARDRFVFKVPQLRNVAETAPYFHDGSVVSLEQAVHLMAEYQLGSNLSDAATASIVTWLGSLTGQ
jgi:cytochrome c peroxidase